MNKHPLTDYCDEYGDRQYMVTMHGNLTNLVEDKTLTVEQKLEYAQILFTLGRCHIYATALQNAHPELSMRVTWTMNNEIKHVYCVDDATGVAFDAYGSYDDEEALITSDGTMLDYVDVDDIDVEDIITYIRSDDLLPPSPAAIFLAEKLVAVNIPA